MDFKITPEALKNGDVLCALIIRFLNNRSEENLLSVLSCLRDSNVFMPAQVSVGGGKAIPNPVLFPTVQNVIVKPQLLKAKDGNVYIPLFSREINAKAGELKQATLVNLPYMNCVEMLSQTEDCGRFVIDPFLYNFVMDEKLIEVSRQIPSRLEKN